MTSTIYSSSAKTIVVSELKSTLRDSSHLSANSRRSEVKISCENTQSSIVYRTRTVRILLGLQIINFLCFARRIVQFGELSRVESREFKVESRDSKVEIRKC